MTERKVPRSSLSECLRSSAAVEAGKANLTNSPPPVSTANQTKQTAKGMRSDFSAPPSWSVDVGSELKRIFSSDCATEHSDVFGCSPPIRSTNPICRNWQFDGALSILPSNAGVVNSNLQSPLRDALKVYGSLLPRV